MSITLHIPDAIADGISIPEEEKEARLRVELALALYAQGVMSFGKARQLAGLDRYLFADLLEKRNIPRHYKQEDLALDAAYARGE